MDILGYLLLAFIAVGFVLCWVAMAISIVKALQKKEKDKKKEKFKSKSTQKPIGNKINVKSFGKKVLEIEEARVENSINVENMKRELS